MKRSKMPYTRVYTQVCRDVATPSPIVLSRADSVRIKAALRLRWEACLENGEGLEAARWERLRRKFEFGPSVDPNASVLRRRVSKKPAKRE